MKRFLALLLCLTLVVGTLAGGNGGGKPDLAMAGLKDETKIDEALNAVPGIVKAALEG